MRITEVDRQLTQADIDQLEIFADRLFAKVGIDVEFTRHFLDRVNDERNVRQITVSELTRLFKQEFKKWGKKIAQLGPDAEAVMKDLATDINMPFALRWDSRNNELDLIAKTVMRKNNFRTSNPEFAVESHIINEQAMPKPNAGGVLGTGLDPRQFQQRYGVTPKQATTSIGNVVKLRPGFRTPRVSNAITNFMLENPGSFQAANDNAKPKGFKLPGWLKGIAGRAFGALSLIFSASPAGDPNETEVLELTNNLLRWMMYNDPQAVIDMYDAEWDSLSAQQKKDMEQWEPKNDPTYQQAQEAQKLLDADRAYRDRRHNELLDRIYDPRNAQPEPAPEVEPDAPAAPEFDPANPDTTPPEDLPEPANDPLPPHKRPNTPGMPDPDVKPEFWPDDIPFTPPAPAPDAPADPADPDKAPDAEPATDPDPRRDAPGRTDPKTDPESDPEVDPSTPTEPSPEVDPVTPTQPQPTDPGTAPDADPTTDPDPRRDAPGRTDQPEPEKTPDAPGKAPRTSPDAPAQPQPSDRPGTAPDADPTTDPDPRRDAPGKTDQPEPEKDPKTDPDSPEMPELPQPPFSPAPGQPTQPDLKLEPLPNIPEPAGLPGVVTQPGTLKAPSVSGTPPTGGKPPRDNKDNKKRRKRDWDWGSNDSDYDNPLRKWVHKHTPPSFESAVMEGGSMPGVGAIHIDEIMPTLAKLEKSLGLNLRDFTLGSVGKREFSGDIDVAINLNPEQLTDFAAKLENDPNIEGVTKSSVFMTKVKIEDFDEEKSDGRPRTGYVQIDFMPGDPGWMKTYYHSPSEKESKYKGVFRNIMIATIAAVYKRTDSEQKLSDGRSLETERYMWSPSDGLIRVRRTPVMNKKGTAYTKKNKNEKIDGPWKQADDIAKELGLGDASVLNSFETLLAAVEKNYSAEQVAQIKQGFADNHVVQDIGVPQELTDK